MKYVVKRVHDIDAGPPEYLKKNSWWNTNSYEWTRTIDEATTFRFGAIAKDTAKVHSQKAAMFFYDFSAVVKESEVPTGILETINTLAGL